ncbi:MAG TPA: AAA family ATPase [Candidatus Saccharimonadales bacterium]|jgi:dephospho-CoA kinase|nr:AAA family ATPase [Candidatus Saccharimonadales bacterium]
MQKTAVVVFVGMPGAGKSSCVSYLEAKSIPSVYFGGIVVKETVRRYGKTSEEHEKIVREEFREKEGLGALAKRIIPEIDELLKTNSRVVADGLYSWSEYKEFKNHFGDKVCFIAIAAPRNVRHERLANRPERPLTDQEISTREYAEIENLEKGGPIANADYTIVNETTAEELMTKLDKILQRISFI